MSELAKWLGRQDWRRDSDGPCISLGAEGEFDDTHVFCPAVIFDGGRYRAGRSGRPMAHLVRRAQQRHPGA